MLQNEAVEKNRREKILFSYEISFRMKDNKPFVSGPSLDILT